MTFEEYVAQLNSLAFWKEFTFTRNKFSPQPGREVELADNLIWLGDHVMVLQLKERDAPSEDSEVERLWFKNKILKKAKRQIRDSIRYLHDHPEIRVVNERGHAFDIRTCELKSIIHLIVYLASDALPEDCRQEQYQKSETAGFIHLISAQDYLGILEKLRVPEDIKRYLEYRQEVLPVLRRSGIVVDEQDIMGGFVSEEALPGVGSHKRLEAFIQDLSTFDLSRLIGNLHDHIERTEHPQDYYRIMLEFARLPRSIWREFKRRVILTLEAVDKDAPTRPYKMTYPTTGCAFAIIPLDPSVPATGAAGAAVRTKAITNLTYTAMYIDKVSKGVGLMVSKDGEHRSIDWCLLDLPWEHDPEMDARLADGSPFRSASVKSVDSFFLYETTDRPV